jgi:predicted DNA-binding transcriptional regulator YafY
MFKEDDDYDRLTITITDEREIIPTIQQYLPFIKVLSPETLSKTIEKNIQNYMTTKLN